MISISWIENIIKADSKIVIAITGGGTRAISYLLENGGGSQFLMEAIVNYSQESTKKLLGEYPEKYASSYTSRLMAVACYNRCVELGVDKNLATGVALTAKLALPKGERHNRNHEIHIALHSLYKTISYSLVLSENRARKEEEELCAELLIRCLYSGFISTPIPVLKPPGLSDKEPVHVSISDNSRLISLQKENLPYVLFGVNYPFDDVEINEFDYIFPGSFNPLHDGHLKIVEIAAIEAMRPVWLEISMKNSDKFEIDYISVCERIEHIKNMINKDNYPYIKGIIISNHSRFCHKSEIYPKGVTFIVGGDTYSRMLLDSEDISQSFSLRENKILVFPRLNFDVPLKSNLQDFTTIITNKEYIDSGISSAKIRKKDGEL